MVCKNGNLSRTMGFSAMMQVILIAIVILSTCVASFQYFEVKNNALVSVVGKWPSLYPVMCAGHAQSPINIESRQAIYESRLKPVQLSSNTAKVAVTVSNNGHSINIAPKSDQVLTFTFGGEGLYEIMNIHFHWGAISSRGSEHKLDGTVFPMEGHLVAFNRALYRNSSVASVSKNGLAVIGFFYNITQNTALANKAINSITNLFSGQFLNGSLHRSVATVISFADLLPANLPTVGYYRYMGSLTTPPCTENVMWTVLRDTVKITESQMSKFRSLIFDNGVIPMVDNFRPVQLLNPSGNAGTTKRYVWKSFQ